MKWEKVGWREMTEGKEEKRREEKRLSGGGCVTQPVLGRRKGKKGGRGRNVSWVLRG